MENRRNMREEIKFEIDHKNIHKSAINNRIYRYAWTKYINILNEERLIKEILENCRDKDEEIRKKYSNELEKLEIEKKIIFNELQEIDKNEDMEK